MTLQLEKLAKNTHNRAFEFLVIEELAVVDRQTIHKFAMSMLHISRFSLENCNFLYSIDIIIMKRTNLFIIPKKI